jgi:hypothetical protein
VDSPASVGFFIDNNSGRGVFWRSRQPKKRMGIDGGRQRRFVSAAWRLDAPYQCLGKKNNMQRYTLHLGDCIEVMKGIGDNSVDSIVTDPPYEINFMGKKFDNTGIAHKHSARRHCA